MKLILYHLRKAIVITGIMLCGLKLSGQARHTTVNSHLKEFTALLNDANIKFIFPAGFKELPAGNNDDFSFDYGMALPGKAFEIWFQIKPQKANWMSYEKSKTDKNNRLANPDSLYIDIGKAQATMLTGGNDDYFSRNISPDMLSRYNADAGRSYLLDLDGSPATRHYRYALLITLQKNHVGTIVAICFSNDKGPEFFKNINKAGNCLKFKS